ncbi:Ig-like domain-containing protein [Leptospira koniambonensis]|nr:Ig-like domain-containing protein [Leptospira koniambonensis]
MRKGISILFLLSLVQCSQLLDNADGPFAFLPSFDVLNDFNPPTVKFTSPIQGATGVDPASHVIITFSKEMNTNYTESSFSLSNNGQTIDGIFEWVENTMVFKPAKPLSSPGLYTYVVTKSRAESISGVNLLDDLRINFSYNSDLTQPKISQTIPADHATAVAPNTFFTIIFDKPMNVTSVLSGISTSPDMGLQIPATVISNNNTRFEFHPAADLAYGTVYTVTIPSSVKDASGNQMAQSSNISFTVGDDFTTPTLSSIQFSSLPTNHLTNEFNVISGMNKTDSIILDFSEPVRPSSLLEAISISPSQSYRVNQLNGPGSSYSITFDEPLDVYQVYNFKITTSIVDLQNNKLDKNYSYYFKIDGSFSQKIRMRAIFSDSGFSNGLFTNQINTNAPQLNTSSCNAQECTQQLYLHFCYDDGTSSCPGSPYTLTTGSILFLSSLKVSIEKEFGPTSVGCLEYVSNITDVTPVAYTPASVLVFSTTAACLDIGSTYLIRVKGGSSGITDNYGNLMDQDYTVRVRF